MVYNLSQERFDMGVEAAYLAEAAKNLAAEVELEEDACRLLRPRLDDFGHLDDETVDKLNLLMTEKERARGNYHLFKQIADTIFGSFMYERFRDSSPEESEYEIADLMAGVNGSPETVRVHYVYYRPVEDELA